MRCRALWSIGGALAVTSGAPAACDSSAGNSWLGASEDGGSSSDSGSSSDTGGTTSSSGGNGPDSSGDTVGATAVEAGSIADAAGGGEGARDAGVGQESGQDADAGACAGLFCEDFEEGQVDPTKWDLQTGGGGMAMLQQQIVAHGKYAWQVHGTGAPGDFATILTKNAPAALQGAGPVFGRAYVYAAASYSAHIQLLFAGTTRDPTVAPAIMTQGINFNYMEVAEIGNSWQLGFDLFTPAPNVAKGFVEEASYPPAHDQYPAMTWNCVEWEFDDNPDQMVLWFDGAQIDQLDAQHIGFSTTTIMPGSVLNGLSSGIIGGFVFFGFGFHSWGGSAVVDRYYDDIVLDTKRVGCLP
jgi:hypothetical protein